MASSSSSCCCCWRLCSLVFFFFCLPLNVIEAATRLRLNQDSGLIEELALDGSKVIIPIKTPPQPPRTPPPPSAAAVKAAAAAPSRREVVVEDPKYAFGDISVPRTLERQSDGTFLETTGSAKHEDTPPTGSPADLARQKLKQIGSAAIRHGLGVGKASPQSMFGCKDSLPAAVKDSTNENKYFWDEPQPKGSVKLYPEPALAVLFERFGGVDEAIDQLLNKLNEGNNRGDASLWSDLGNAFRVKGDTSRAVHCFNAALEIRTHADFYLNLGGVHFIVGELQEAVSIFKVGLRLDPRHVLLRFSLGNANVALGNRDLACQEFETAIRIQPDFSAAKESLRHLSPADCKRKGKDGGRKGDSSASQSGGGFYGAFRTLALLTAITGVALYLAYPPRSSRPSRVPPTFLSKTKK